MRTYIPENILYLVKKTGCTQDEFGAIFGLNKSVINHYAANSGVPKLITVLKICSHFEISVDDFIYKSLAHKNSSDENRTVETDGDLLKKQSQLVASLEEEVERLNSVIIKLRAQKNTSV